MGSLMAGWASCVLHDEKERLERNKSLTKAEIETYWKMHQEKEVEEEKKSNSDDSNFLEEEEEESNNNRTTDWWTKSNWAFLNESPHEEMNKPNKYASQFHVAELVKKKTLE
ncbi:hypothetical protein DsansV1_C13g0123621 [Dioscorea sansibarensis]